MKLVCWGQSDVGQKRDHNEDAFVMLPEEGLFVVADGMGGHLGGDRASRMAVDLLPEQLRLASNASEPPADRPTADAELAEPFAAAALRAAARAAGRRPVDMAVSEAQGLRGLIPAQ